MGRKRAWWRAILLLAVLLVPAALLVPCCVPSGILNIPGEARPGFSLDTAAFLRGDGNEVLDIVFQTKNSELVFVRTGTGFRADFELTIVVYDRKGKQITGDVWNLAKYASDYDETKTEAVFTHRASFPLSPGKYELTARMRDLTSHRTSVLTRDLEVKNLARGGLRLSGLFLGSCVLPESVYVSGVSAGDLNPSAYLRFGESLYGPCVYGEIYFPAGFDSTLRVVLAAEIRSETGALKTKMVREFQPHGRSTPFMVSPDVSKLVLGGYVVSVRVSSGEWTDGTKKYFEIDESRIDFEKNFEEILQMLEVITSADETYEMREAKTPQQRKAAWNRFWKARDPDPSTVRNEALVEFFRRVRYANQHFGGTDDGWKSDRGRVYIIYGPPTDVETRPMSGNSPPYEVWYYTDSGRVFVFVDRAGFGRYELIGPITR